MSTKSILQTKKECFLCRLFCGETLDLPSTGLHLHHVFYGTANRKQSDKYGLVVWLCPEHHTNGEISVHRLLAPDMIVKRFAQQKFEEEHSRDEFIKIFGRSWL